MNFADIKIENKVFLAPMAGVTDMPFRILCREQGCGLVYTEMVSAKGMHYNDIKSKALTRIADEEKPAAVQIFGSDPEILAGIAKQLDESDACLIDINMGCPAPKITKNGEGSALMKRPDLIGQIVKAVSLASSKPVTVKIRKGWDDSSINAVEVAKIAEENGAKAITVHGRTREQYYSGKADWEIIKKVKEAVSIPVIGNGDVFGPKEAERLIQETNCDAIMVGRGAQGNPWIFKKILHYFETGDILQDPTPEEKIKMIIRHMEMLVELKGMHIGICEMRKHISWYIKGLRNATYVKEKVFRLTSKDEIISLLEEYMEGEI
ncbi:MAG TPA: tRNA dihydrouridine synthase DusB [Pseudobacteroides sp.]|uniref:tRNA dihydrouridine synthase DusB n=1 Tax=Pseudobacteroides sp. TaxID=1968840 RepID=UPI002F954782